MAGGASKFSEKRCFDTSREAFEQVLKDVSCKIGLELTREQLQSLKYFINGCDIFFVSLPTGHGKSLIFQMIVPVINRLQEIDQNAFSQYPKNPLNIVIAPLLALSYQISACEKFGLTAIRHDKVETINKDHNIIFTSPETLAPHLSLIKDVEDRVVGVVVDESHCVVYW